VTGATGRSSRACVRGGSSSASRSSRSTRGALPGRLALPAGWGDIAVAAAVVAAGAAVPVTTRARWWTVLVWSVLVLIDILMVLGAVLRLGLEDRAQVAVMATFPTSLLPTFVVPLIVVTHVLIFGRLRHTRP
jgi:hypothetical protein